MQARYHVEATKQVLGGALARSALAQVVTANVGQDSLRAVLGAEPYRHYCDPVLEHSRAYIEQEHALIAGLVAVPDGQGAQRAAFGRLLHTVQDFYAHSNYVDLWLANMGLEVRSLGRGGAEGELITSQVNALDPQLLGHPYLRIGDWVFWRDLVFYVPLVGPVVRRFWVPPHSHEAMHLDSPRRGPRFGLALTMACQRTQEEYRRVVATLHALGGQPAVARFCGDPQPTHALPSAAKWEGFRQLA